VSVVDPEWFFFGSVSFFQLFFFVKKELYFQIEHFVEKLSDFISFQSEFTSNSFRTRSYPDPE
jgi:hypothetical protein